MIRPNIVIDTDNYRELQNHLWIKKGINPSDFFDRNHQHEYSQELKKLSKKQIRQLKKQGNTSFHWDKIYITKDTDISLINYCRFYGLNRIGKLQKGFIAYKSYQLPIGLYNSTIINTDIGDNNSINHVNLLSHYILQDNVFISNANQIVTTPFGKFGVEPNQSEEADDRKIWLEIRNENTKRKILPFLNMTTIDAYLCSEYKWDKVLYEKLLKMTYEQNRSYLKNTFGRIERNTVIRNCSFIKDVHIGSSAYLKGVNKIKNVTIKSTPDNPVQIGEGCELVNGIINAGCNIFYGVKAVRFIVHENTSLKYGARLINSIMGSNSNVSCCEILNTLTYAFHTQHHNNSFLCSSFIKGQSNIAAGATIGSNHSSRALDGELTAERGFWPGLCTSFRFSSKFASFNMLAKANYPYEINNPFPFALIYNSLTTNELNVIPDFLLASNAYFLFRNKIKYPNRDKRQNKNIHFEYDFIAPDTIQQIEKSLMILKKLKVINNDSAEIPSDIYKIEHSSRKVVIKNVQRAIASYEKILKIYLAKNISLYLKQKSWQDFQHIVKIIFPLQKSYQWDNIGGQMILTNRLEDMIHSIKNDVINTWSDVHSFFEKDALQYHTDKLMHALWVNAKYFKLTQEQYGRKNVAVFLHYSLSLFEELRNQILVSRRSDFQNEFVDNYYETQEKKDFFLGKLEEDITIKDAEKYYTQINDNIKQIISKLKI